MQGRLLLGWKLCRAVVASEALLYVMSAMVEGQRGAVCCLHGCQSLAGAIR
jgi:hypothetical protein